MIVAWTAPIRLAVLTLAGGFGAITLGWAVSTDTETSATTLPPRTSAALLPQMPSRTLTSNFDAIIDRPLFSQTRRPIQPKPPQSEPQPQPASAPPPPPLAATLLGIIISPGVKSAVIRLSNGKSVTVKEGDSVDGWELTHVEPDFAQLRNKGASVELSFPIHQTSPAQLARTTAPGSLVRRRQ